jgi:hypothetical protein
LNLSFFAPGSYANFRDILENSTRKAILANPSPSNIIFIITIGIASNGAEP